MDENKVLEDENLEEEKALDDTLETETEVNSKEVVLEKKEEVKESPKEIIYNKEAINAIENIADILVDEQNNDAFYFSALGYGFNSLYCCHLLGYCYMNGLGVEKDVEKGNFLLKGCFDRLLEMADNGDSRAQYYVGFHYLKGYGIEKDQDEAFDYFAKARLQGNERAQARLFAFSEKASSSKANRWERDKAMKMAEKAMEIESEFIESGKDSEELPDLLKEVENIAKLGNHYAESLLARWYETGTFTDVDPKKAIYWYEKSAEGNLDAMLYLAKCYENGIGVDKDDTKAFEWYLKASKLKDAFALNKVGDAYYDGIGCEQDYDKSFEFHKAAADLGYSDAKYKLGIHYYNAEGCKKDIKECLRWYEEAAKDNYALAEYRLGSCYQGVHGVEKDEKLSQYWFIRAAIDGSEDASEKVGIIGAECKILDFDLAIKVLKSSAEKGNVYAEYILGRVYEQETENQDLDKALEYYQLACEHNVKEAFERFGCGADGKGYAKDTSRFMFWYERALNGINPLAKMRLGYCYEIGNGTEQSNEKALSWYDQSALAGCKEAQFMLGNFYRNHNPLVEVNDSKAVYYYELAAKQDFVDAQMALAECYEKGFGTEKNINNTVFWLQRAEKLKNYDAEKRLKKFKRKSDGNWVKKLF